MERIEKNDLIPDVVIVTGRESTTPMRRIIRVMDGRVIYCYGGDRLRDCKVESFISWARRNQAKVTHRPNHQ